MSFILAIESSCDESSIALSKDDKVIKTITFSHEKKFFKIGGVVPEIASRLHEQTLPLILNEIVHKLKVDLSKLDAIAVTISPGLIGCLQVGLQMAKTLCLKLDKPLIAVNHLVGHIYSPEITQKLNYPFLALVVTGGNTQLVLVSKEFNFKILGATKDDAIGECFDKVSRTLGGGYPGGPIIEKWAEKGKKNYHFPITNLNGYDFSYSGLKSAVLNLINKRKQKNLKIDRNDIAYSFQEQAFSQLLIKVKKAIREYKVNNLVVVGGVSANSYLKSFLKKNLDCLIVFPKKEYCSDNAAMIAQVASKMFSLKKFSSLDIDSSCEKKINI